MANLLPACHKPLQAGDRLVIGMPQAYFLYGCMILTFSDNQGVQIIG